MNNQIFGIIIIVICVIGYFYSWKYHSKENYKLAIALLIICGLILRVYCSMDFFLHNWDERYHALVAKNLMKHMLVPTLYDNPIMPYDFKSWTGSHIWLHKQPLPLWTMAISMQMFGVNEIALRIPSIVLTTIGIGLTFYIGTYFFNKKVGFLAAFFYSINGLIIEITSGRIATDHIDVFFLFFVELAVFFTIVFAKKRNTIYNILVGIAIGFAILSKWLPALIVLPIWLLIIIDSQNFNRKTIIIQFLLLLTVVTIVFLPWQLYIHHMYPVEARWEESFNYKHITMVLEEQGGPFYYFLNKIRINYGDLIYLPILWFLWKFYKHPNNYKNLSLVIWFLIPLLFFSFIKTKMQAYILFTSPALFIITAIFFYWLIEVKKSYKYKWIITLLLILLIVLPVRYSIERVKPFEKKERAPEWVSDLKNLNNKKINKGMLFNYPAPIEAMFYTDFSVYSSLPDKTDVYSLIQKGYTVIINDKGNIPNEISLIEGVKIERLLIPD